MVANLMTSIAPRDAFTNAVQAIGGRITKRYHMYEKSLLPATSAAPATHP